MAGNSQYLVKHHLFHDKIKIRRGSTVELSKKDALPLLAKGIIAVPNAETDVITTQAPSIVFSPATLSKLNLTDLKAYAGHHGVEIVEIGGPASRDEILAAIAARADAQAARLDPNPEQVEA